MKNLNLLGQIPRTDYITTHLHSQTPSKALKSMEITLERNVSWREEMQKLHRANYRTACAPYCATVKHHDSKPVCKKHTYAQKKHWENTDQKRTVFLRVMIFLSVFPDSFFKKIIYFSWRLITLQYSSGFWPYIDMNQPWVHMCSDSFLYFSKQSPTSILMINKSIQYF